ncbi:MAG: AAA family ATPase [Bacteroidetes bacterium]|nr:AAA family ATPase [Bacteroidota bacterium]
MKKIVVIGPESTGKSTLCQKLATHFKTVWVEEYAREYLLEHGTNYTFEQLLDVAKGQLKKEDDTVNRLEAAGQQPPFILVDTDMQVMKVWCEFVFGKCHHWILNRIAERQYDLYLLCNIDVPWVKDELREYPEPETRKKLYHHYKELLVNQSVPWVDISGGYDERLQKAIEAINTIINPL